MAHRDAGSHPTIVFLHIGRTAGTTLNSVLDRQYPQRAIYQFDSHRLPDSIAEFRSLPAARRSAMRVVRGHVDFGIHEAIPGPSTYITMLREPVERLISHYQYVRERPHRLSQRVVEQNMTLEEYVRSGISVELNDWQTRVLAGATETPFGTTDRELLERALANIEEHFALVGLSERFEETVVMLKRIFGWKRAYYTKLNATRDRPPRTAVPERALAAIREFNALDIELYEWGRNRLEEMVDADPAFALDLEAFQRHNDAYGRFPVLDRTLQRGVKLRRRLLSARKVV
jgi:galactose-3-O-sulfotransferase